MIDATAAAVPLRWATVPIERIETVTPTVKSFTLRTGWSSAFRAGQSVDLRLTAPDGYQAQRSYSIASSPLRPSLVEIMIEHLPDGEVSGFFHDVAAVGDDIEMRGPIGSPFTWGPDDGGPLLLVAGGSGVVPLLSMLRLRAEAAPQVPAVLLASAQQASSLIARGELLSQAAADPLFHLRLHVTRAADAVVGGIGRRIDAAAIGEALTLLGGAVPRCYVCGANGFVTAMSDLLLDAGVPATTIRTERFG